MSLLSGNMPRANQNLKNKILNMLKLCLYLIAISLVLFSKQVNARQGDLELNRDSVAGWRYVINPPNPNAFYKPIKNLKELFK